MMIRKPAGRALGETEYLLEQWGWWRIDCVGVPGFTSPTLALMRLASPQARLSKNYYITDDLAISLDNAIARLTKRDQQMGDVTWLYYGVKWSMLRVAKYYGISEGKAREISRAAVAWIDCALTVLEDAR